MLLHIFCQFWPGVVYKSVAYKKKACKTKEIKVHKQINPYSSNAYVRYDMEQSM